METKDAVVRFVRIALIGAVLGVATGCAGYDVGFANTQYRQSSSGGSSYNSVFDPQSPINQWSVF